MISISPGGIFQKLSSDATFVMFTYIHSLLIEKDVCDRKNILIKFPCIYMSFPPEITSIFGKSLSFPLFSVIL